ncbi:hypothetical protein ACP0AK_05545 [Listeria ivanovii]|uniref:hypothetical protein n=1 Tax=Listeria ivanovii TaxID=1638 RepID=UPI0001EBBB98|nr:hypothetical protein [Listeria ivanovii]EFR97858.1 1,4-dihydroxy-2-naphthoate octaprenyltransferase [Listeria ivanovii FSL F6-596]MBC1758667.1 hypothetical protein [Listeria ivanovii]MBC2254740.1 hypothetical protein [Listeria ivanovii]MBK1965711.1 hypothetical protein [Listeria ivanovii subsp. londoniensis]MBK1985921.1 hypothetical protein [Listeria ivanovii subsp. londoniensis]
MNYKKLIASILLYIVLFIVTGIIFDNFNIFVLVVGTICYALAIIPLVKNK